MDYCGPIGLPHSQFKSWSEDDQDKAVAWVLKNREVCPNCGTIPTEWFGENGIQLEPPPYQVAVHYCPGCAAMDEQHAMLPKGQERRYRMFMTKWRPPDESSGDSWPSG